MAAINYLNTINIGKATGWEGEKTANIDPVTLPGGDSAYTSGVDTLGVIKYFSLKGRLTGSDVTLATGITPFSSIQARIFAIESLLDGKQIAPSKLYSPFIVGKVEKDDGSLKNSIGTSGRNTLEVPTALYDSNNDFELKGIKAGDYVRNMVSGATTKVTERFSAYQLNIESDIFPNTDTPYMVTANINVKLLKFKTRWELPGLTYCDYELKLMQVR